MNKNEFLEKLPLVHPAGAVMAGLKQHQISKKIKQTQHFVEEVEKQRNAQIDEALKTFKGISRPELEKQLNFLDRLEAKNPKAYAEYAKNAQMVLANPTPQNIEKFSKFSANLGVKQNAQTTIKMESNSTTSPFGPKPIPEGIGTGDVFNSSDYKTATKKGITSKILVAIAVCGMIGATALSTSNSLGDGFGFSLPDIKLPEIKLPDFGNGGGSDPDFSEYASAAVPTTGAEVDKNKCYVQNVDENSVAFKNMIASKDYQAQVEEITKQSQQQIEALKTQLNTEVATKIQSVDAIEEASGYEGPSFYSHMGFDRLPGSGDNGLESLGAFNLRWINALENEQMTSNQKIDDYFYENVPEYTKDLYAKYGIDLSFGHFKSVEDFTDHDMELKLVKITNPEENKLYHMINGKPYEYVITSYDEEKLPENVNLDFIQEFLIKSSEHLTFYHDITNGDLWSDYRKSSYYENNDVSKAQNSLDSYYNNIGEPYASQVKQIKAEIDVMQDDYLKQVEQINNNTVEQIANIQTNNLNLDNDLIALGVQAMDGAKTDKSSLIQSLVDSVVNAADSAKEVAETLTDDLIQSF